jgi:hypothetical protein
MTCWMVLFLAVLLLLLVMCFCSFWIFCQSQNYGHRPWRSISSLSFEEDVRRRDGKVFMACVTFKTVSPRLLNQNRVLNKLATLPLQIADPMAGVLLLESVLAVSRKLFALYTYCS